MNEKIIMSKEAFNELIHELEYLESLIEYGRKNIKYHVQKLQQENKQLKAQIEEYQKALDETMSEKIDIQNNWNKLKEYFNERIEICDNRLSTPFCNF